MGFEEPARTLTLVFDDEDYAGAEVICRRNVATRLYFDISKANAGATEEIEVALRLFGDHVLHAWNIERKGKVLSADGEGMLDISPEFALLIVASWVRALTEVPRPLDEPSPNGVPLPAQPIPMVALSGSQPS